MSDHISVEELADAAEELLVPARADVVRAHLTGCADCRGTAELLASVSATLAAEPAPAMPTAVIARLDAVIAEEQSRRSVPLEVAPAPESAQILTWRPRPRLPAQTTHPHLAAHRRRAVGWVLAAAAAASLVGFGGYVVSARAGLNEPPSGAAAVSSGDLGEQASALERSKDIDPHRFSRAWSCARRVTDGRITGIASVTVDGTPALLVYLESDSRAEVAVVEGCDDDAPRLTATRALTG